MYKGKKIHIIPNQLRNYRLEAGLKQSEVAFLLDIKNIGRISEWESGVSNPSLEHLLSLGLIYSQLPDQLYYELRKGLAQKLKERQRMLREQKDANGDLQEGR